MNRYQPRPFQQEMIKSALLKASTGEKYIIADVHPGSGKTLGCLLAAEELYKQDVINRVIVFVPRTNLARQFEDDYKRDLMNIVQYPTLLPICHRDNNPPLIRGHASGYVTTYDSLMSSSSLHIQQVKGARTLVIFDEAQQLGTDMYGKTSTASAEVAKKIGDAATLVFMLSGTPYRSDNKKLLFADYDDPDETGFASLRADVRATYLIGVRSGYLRPFEAILHNGSARWQNLGESHPEKYVLSEMDKAVYKVIREPGYWHGLIDKFMAKVEEVQTTVHPKLCGLVAAYDQDHAEEIQAYLRKKYSWKKTLLAVSRDGKEAQHALDGFKQGIADVLITVSMAYVGYDHKPISVVCVLTGFRTEGYLRQLIARGLRIWDQVEIHRQTCYAIVPDDIKMQQFVEKLRIESECGVLLREETQSPTGTNGTQLTMGIPLDSELTTVRARGLNPTGDLDHDEYAHFEQLKQKAGLQGTASTKLAVFVKLHNSSAGETTVSVETEKTILTTESPRTFETEREKEQRLRKDLNKIIRKLAVIFYDSHTKTQQEKGQIYKKIYYLLQKHTDGKVVASCTSDEIQQRKERAYSWLRQGEIPT